MSEMVSLQRQGSLLIARCRGELDVATRDDLRVALAGVPDQTTSAVLVDLAAVTFMDCAALGVLIALARSCADNDTPLIICRAQGVVRRLITVLDLEDVFPLVATVREAVHLATALSTGSNSTGSNHVETRCWPKSTVPCARRPAGD